jgi:hypothetical protein
LRLQESQGSRFDARQGNPCVPNTAGINRNIAKSFVPGGPIKPTRQSQHSVKGLRLNFYIALVAAPAVEYQRHLPSKKG